MPFYDRECANRHQQLDCYEPIVCADPICAACGVPMDRVWLSKPANVIGDECQITQENGFRHPRTFTSKIERRRALKEAGLEEVVRHVAAPGTDRSKHTINWAGRMDAKTLENATALVSRQNSVKSHPGEAPVNMRIRYVSGEL